MTVASSTDRATFPGNGVTQIFPLPFRFFANSEIQAWLVTNATGVLTALTLGTHYTLTGASEPEVDGSATGQLTMLTPPTALQSLFVHRIIPVTQPTDIVNQGQFFPEIHENVFDRLTMLNQQNSGAISRVIRVQDFDPEPAKLPSAALRALKIMSFDDLGNPVAIDAASDSSLVLRQDLAENTNPVKGSALVGRVYRQVDTIAQLKTLPNSGSQYAEVLEYSTGAGVINSRYHLDLSDVVTADNGFTVIVAADGGRWKLKHADPYTLKMAGGKEDGVTDDADAWDRLLAMSQGKAVQWSGVSMVGRSIDIPVSTLRLHAITKAATIKAMDGTDFEYTLSAVGKSKLEFKGFTVDSNKAGRELALTTRTVSVSLVSCTDCDVTEVSGINAIGSASIPGIGISTAGTGLRVHTKNCLALDCGVVGKAADGFFCSSSQSINAGNVAINCLDTGHVLESCSYSGIVDCVSIDCGVVGAITNAIGTDTYGNFINGLRGQDWNSAVTGGIQISALAAGNLLETSIAGVALVGVANFIGPGISLRRTSTGRVEGVTIEASVRNGNTQGILIDSAKDVSIDARVAGTAAACIQVMGDSSNIVVSGKSNLRGGTYGVISQGTSQVLVHGAHIRAPSSYGIYAFDTSVMTSTMNDIVSPGVAYEGKDAGATLNRMTLVNGLFSLESVVASAPLTATLTSKFTAADKTGGVAGVVGLSVN